MRQVLNGISRVLVTTYFFVFALSLSAQNAKERLGEKFFYDEDFTEALTIYKEILAEDPEDIIAQYHIEVCSLLTKYPQKSIKHLINIGEEVSAKDKFYNYWLGRALYGQYEFEKAIKSWEKFLAIKKYKSREIINETIGFIGQAEFANNFYKTPESHHAQRLPDIVNTHSSEITPTYLDELNELLYASSASQSTITHSAHPFHVFTSFYDGSAWSEPELQSSLGEYDEDNVNLEIVGNDGRLLMFKPHESGGMHESELLHDSIWTQPHLFDLHIKRSKLKPHFYVNEQENILIFSTRKGKNGDLNLEYSVKAGNKWTKARPFGNTINTSSNEESAFLASDGKTLYFSSDGHTSVGNYDIFKSVYDSIGDQWSTPENLGYPINTINNELYFKLKPNGREGFFSSDRFHSKGGYDIYHFWEASYNLIRGKVMNSNTQETIPKAYIRYHPTKFLDTDFSGFSDEDGKYQLHIIPGDTYDVEVFFDHKMIYHEAITIPEEHDPNIVIEKDLIIPTDYKALIVAKDNSLHSSNDHAKDLNDHLSAEEPHNERPVPKEFSTVEKLGSKFRKGHKALIHNVYFKTASAELTEADKEVLQELVDMMIKYPDLQIEISGHTDNTGTPSVNLTLSEDRADNVARFLISKGIKLTRLQSIGYGESRPIATNDDEIGGRELNRRIEIVVIE